MSGIEILDGFSADWGFSMADMAFNVTGVGLFAAQEALFNKQRIKMKFSSHLSPYAQYRQDVLGKSYMQRLLKDYNGQTYWLSTSIADFAPQSKWPKWLDVAVGYSADGMLGGKSNPTTNEQGQILPTFERQSQFYLSFDVDLEDLPAKKRWVRSVLKTLNFVKIPLPVVGFEKSRGMFFQPVYF